jgi:hypothetical protein
VLAYSLALRLGPLVQVGLILLGPLVFLLGYAVLGHFGVAGYNDSCEEDQCLANLALVFLVGVAWIGFEAGAIGGWIHSAVRERRGKEPVVVR